jgi:hypothetical protein
VGVDSATSTRSLIAQSILAVGDKYQMAQELWFRSDLKHIIEGLALSFVHAQALSGAAQAVSYQHGFFSALLSVGSCLGIANLDLSVADRSLDLQVTVSGPAVLVGEDPHSLLSQGGNSTEHLMLLHGSP